MPSPAGPTLFDHKPEAIDRFAEKGVRLKRQNEAQSKLGLGQSAKAGDFFADATP